MGVRYSPTFIYTLDETEVDTPTNINQKSEVPASGN